MTETHLNMPHVELCGYFGLSSFGSLDIFYIQLKDLLKVALSYAKDYPTSRMCKNPVLSTKVIVPAPRVRYDAPYQA